MELFWNIDPSYRYWTHHNLAVWMPFNILVSLGFNLSWMSENAIIKWIPLVILYDCIWWLIQASVKILHCILTHTWFTLLGYVKILIKTGMWEDQKKTPDNKCVVETLIKFNWTINIWCFKETSSTGLNFAVSSVVGYTQLSWEKQMEAKGLERFLNAIARRKKEKIKRKPS